MNQINGIDILGTRYAIRVRNQQEDEKLKRMDGYCDTSVKLIVVFDGSVEHPEDALANIMDYRDKVLRHEIIHAFLHESGLSDCSSWDDKGQEQMVDWMALQWHKIQEVFRSLAI